MMFSLLLLFCWKKKVSFPSGPICSNFIHFDIQRLYLVCCWFVKPLQKGDCMSVVLAPASSHLHAQTHNAEEIGHTTSCVAGCMTGGTARVEKPCLSDWPYPLNRTPPSHFSCFLLFPSVCHQDSSRIALAKLNSCGCHSPSPACP